MNTVTHRWIDKHDFREIKPGLWLRPEDEREMMTAASTDDRDKAMWELVAESDVAVGVAECAEGVVALYGLATNNLMGPGVACPWMVATPLIYMHVRELMRYSRWFIDQALRVYPILMNYVDSRNTVHVRWLRHMGFHVYDTLPVFIRDVAFYPFDMRR
jgi:hypothetical protein